jgi:hypothetical protein
VGSNSCLFGGSEIGVEEPFSVLPKGRSVVNKYHLEKENN